MTEHDSDTDAAPRLPRRTTPTWDMELVVSAASVFTLVQVPGWMDDFFLALRPRLDTDWELLARLLYTYGKLGVLLLAGAFALHVAMRAYWIALVGMDSIYPEGVRWEKLRVGPIRRRFLLERAPSMAERIEDADNRSSIVFAVGLTMAAIQLALLVVVIAAYALSLALARGLHWDWMLPNGLFVVVAALAVPYALAARLDRARGDRLAPGGRTARAIAAVYRAYARIGYGRGGGTAIDLLQSHHGARKVQGWALAAVVACSVVAVAQLGWQQGRLTLGDYARWPEADGGRGDSLLPENYRDQSPPASSLLPTIDSAFPAGDHVVLMVPFDPKRLPAQLDAACPATWRAAESAQRRTALLDCLGRWLAPRLDGVALPPPRLRYTADARTGQRAVLAVVPIAALAAGEHVLAVRRAPSPDGAAPTDPADHLIVFWK